MNRTRIKPHAGLTARPPLTPLEMHHASMKTTNWPIRIGLWIVNVGVLLVFVPGSFSWSAVAVMFALWYITGGIGVSYCYHRTLTHSSLIPDRTNEYATALFASLALQVGPISWVATHRIHHAHSD